MTRFGGCNIYGALHLHRQFRLRSSFGYAQKSSRTVRLDVLCLGFRINVNVSCADFLETELLLANLGRESPTP